MNDPKRRYKQMEKYITYVLLGTLLFFIIYLIASACAIQWLKAITATLTLLASVLCLGYLYLCKELLHRRSLWMSVAFAGLTICVLFSLILRFPSPNPYKSLPEQNAIVAEE